ncbi:MAG: hypothetical protein RBS80_29295 [Thermoguttaceae bacterium]|jgi:YD repeat-containing protein|nr:hypothetical protein [Thermoguttaceae bacterium]
MVERHHDADADADGHYPEDGTVDPDDVLLAREETFYDDRGQVYRTRTHAVDPADGTVGAYLEGNTWYDAAGNAVKQQSAGARSFTKSTYDGLGRAVRQYTGYDDAETTYAEVLTVEGDTILQQQEAVYNEAGSVVFSTTWRRMDDATGTGALSAPDGEQPIARVSYTAAWYDELGRTTATADYGTGGGVPPVRPAAAPLRSDTVLVSETRYNDRGEAFATIDPAGVESRTESDAAGRQIRAIQNYQADSDAEDENVTVEMAYNADGNLRTLTAKNPATGDQVTRYVYGSHLGVDSPLICRNDLLRAEIYPDSDDTPDLGDGADGVFDRVEYEYNRLGETIQKKDQNGTVHTYDYDPLGRQVGDRVTELGEGVDGAVRRIERTFEVRGLPETITSFDSPTSGGVVNQVKMEYNSFGQLISDYQEHAAVVSVGTSPGN